MFNIKLKKDALIIHEKAEIAYKASYEMMMRKSEKLYQERETVINLIKEIESFINSIANTPKEFDKKMGLVKEEIKQFQETEKFAKEALEGEIKAGVGVAVAAGAGLGFAGIAPKVAMWIATTFGRASTGVAIRTLHGVAAQKAALAFLGRGALAAGGAGIAGGKALLALAGPIGWGLAGADAALMLGKMAKKNKKVSHEAVENAKRVMREKESIDETSKQIEDLCKKTINLRESLANQMKEVSALHGADYSSLGEEQQILLGTVVNNSLSLASLLNTIIE